ncbi:DUF4185 domain-containing protein [Aeromicrobium sp. 9AM]|uniref:DUF4185 domain-containing protein n=1 Tax=Aeromicrobium sp. 9AM TaxID=2653126 RepID=UPI0012F2511F|nr:DUF4185 domain-containing protein [Aeromicrobium sp. 9AM]VXC30086.1 conserved hypothetical protein [Aeromicrobium sp. 9AM]
MTTELHPTLRRHPRVAALALALVLAASLLVWSPWRHDVERSTPPDLASTRCLPFDEPRSVADLNRIVAGYRTTKEFQGGDVGADVTLQDGRQLYVFGDTLRAPSYGGERFVRNSMLVFGPHCAGIVSRADHGAMIPDRSDGVGYWPMSIAKVTRGSYDLVGVMAQRVRTTGPQHFENLGSSLAVFRVDRGASPQLVKVTDLGPDDAHRTRTTWGAAAVVKGDWVYLYGTANPEKRLVFGWSLRVARTRIDDLAEPSRWQYFDGTRWQADPAKASTLIPAEGGVSQTLSVFESGGRWYALSKRDDFVGKDLVVWSAPGPAGPFTPSRPLASIPSHGARLQYMPLAHPDVLTQRGTVVVSVSHNTTDAGLLEQDPYLYRPTFLRVKLP